MYRQPPEALRSLSNSAGFPPQLYNSSIVPPTHESISAGLLPSFGSRERTDTSIANTFSLASSSPTFSARELTCLRHSTVLRHPQPNTSLLLSHSASNSTASSSRDPPLLSRLPDYPYASPGVPIPFPPYQTLPNPELSTSQLNLQRLAVEVNGYVLIRNAISHALVQEVVASINTGLPVVAKFKTLKIYATPSQADTVRDEFILVCSLILLLLLLLLLLLRLISISITEIAPRPPVVLRVKRPNRSRDASRNFRRVFHGK